ncbi:hypothetical protein DL546_002881 [Coniochaeta pulveracea]|uniref:Uncharacterized protein n=1 Tax=Coniochaeta pulveracea TaxID=177199 RepID=A0A420YDU5_9PEZI|nr:hypothetical protein DL546_002881 [Coniochaeta pulveracea]
MARKKTKAQRQAALALAWDDYFGGGELADWQRLLHDLGIEGDFTSKRQCKKAMAGVWINICDFLAAPDKRAVHHFSTEQELSQYTLASNRCFPKQVIVDAPKGSPLKLLLAHILEPRRPHRRQNKARR